MLSFPIFFPRSTYSRPPTKIEIYNNINVFIAYGVVSYREERETVARMYEIAVRLRSPMYATEKCLILFEYMRTILPRAHTQTDTHKHRGMKHK